jgi:penicillin-binding protein A
VNRSITRLYVLVILLLALLVGFTSYWSVFDASELRAKPDNRRALIEAQKIRRGSIRTEDGTLVAVSQPRGTGNQRIFVRHYPQGDLFGHPVGYSYVEFGSSELERSENDVLIGRDNEFKSIIDQLEGRVTEGSNITLTLNDQAQQTALTSLQNAITVPGTGGAVVAMEPSTGAIRAMVSDPPFDPNRVPADFKQLNQEKSSPLVNRPTQSVYPPGSTMKVVTATAALDSGQFNTSTTLNGDSGVKISGVPLQNAGGEDFGNIDMTTALTNSVNTYWAQIGEKLGTATMVEYMKRFGFYSDPPIELPSDEIAPSGAYNSAHHLVTSGFDAGRVAIGQGGAEGQDLATALQMAMVASAVANKGHLEKPTLIQRVTDADGRVTSELSPSEQSDVMSEQTAHTVAGMMTKVAQEGTAAGLSVQGATLAGKTGTAEIDPDTGLNQAWFIGFAPVDAPKIVVAATVERCNGCFGGDTAGPIATDVMDVLLNQ